MAGSTPASATAELSKATASVSPWVEAWRRFKRHRLAYWSLWVLGLLVLVVLFGPLFYKVGINDVDFKARLAAPNSAHRWAPTTWAATSWRACSTAGASRWPWACRRC